MTKKIFSISMVKNEIDIIESFVRYNINIFDGMIILDNGSTDNTLQILKKLKDEGLPIFVFEDTDREYEQAIKMNSLLLTAINEFKADIIVPLDADEFLISTDKGNPRFILDEMDEDTFYLAKWKTYIPDFDQNQNEDFIPSKMTLVRDENVEEFYKAIIPKELVLDYNAELIFGNHDLIYDSHYESKIKRIINPNLRIAHFPIRSKEQTISKISVGWIYSLYRLGRKEGENFHWKLIFDKLKENQEITNGDIINFAKQFALQNNKNITLHEDPMDLTFCDNIKMIYPNKINPISNLLESCEWLALSFLNSNKEYLANEQKLKKEIDDLSIQLQELSNMNSSLKKQHNIKIKEFEGSTSWAITAPLRRIGKLMK